MSKLASVPGPPQGVPMLPYLAVLCDMSTCEKLQSLCRLRNLLSVSAKFPVDRKVDVELEEVNLANV
jgi:hypothetical protein